MGTGQQPQNQNINVSKIEPQTLFCASHGSQRVCSYNHLCDLSTAEDVASETGKTLKVLSVTARWSG